MFETDVKAVSLAAVECSFFEPFWNTLFPNGLSDRSVLFPIFIVSIIDFAATNFAPFISLFYPALQSVNFDLSQITDLSVQERLRSTFIDVVGRCFELIPDDLLSGINAGFNSFFQGQ